VKLTCWTMRGSLQITGRVDRHASMLCSARRRSDEFRTFAVFLNNCSPTPRGGGKRNAERAPLGMAGTLRTPLIFSGTETDIWNCPAGGGTHIPPAPKAPCGPPSSPASRGAFYLAEV
jgi:hypothetical protein